MSFENVAHRRAPGAGDVHQAGVDETGLLVLALAAGGLHASAGALALAELVTEPSAARLDP